MGKMIPPIISKSSVMWYLFNFKKRKVETFSGSAFRHLENYAAT